MSVSVSVGVNVGCVSVMSMEGNGGCQWGAMGGCQWGLSMGTVLLDNFEATSQMYA